jgi:hypothetical protein
MKVPQWRRQRFAACPQRTHYYKSARLEKLASPVKKNEKNEKNEKPLLELRHPRMEIPTLSTTNSEAFANAEAEETIHSGLCAVWDSGGLRSARTI